MFELKTAKTIFEPFKIKMVEPIPVLSQGQREQAIAKADFNLFRLPAKAVTFDFLTDSGTSAMSAKQWGAIMEGDESYAGAVSFDQFERSVQDVFGFEHVIPTHQGRAAEHLLFQCVLKPGQWVMGNTHFDTTHANILVAGGHPINLPDPSNEDSQRFFEFKGNLDCEGLKRQILEHRDQIAAVIMTITNNSVGGQPVSLANLRQTSAICRQAGIPFFIDCARFAENAFFIKMREPEAQQWDIRKIVSEMFSLADGAMMSAKKDGLANIGGFIALRDPDLAQLIRTKMVVTEGFPTYGGLAGRDMAALAVGFQEVLDEDYLRYRIRSTQYMADGFSEAGYPTVQPSGGHAVYLDAGKLLPDFRSDDFPGQALSVALYEAVGIRGVEVGSVMLGSLDPATGKEIAAPKELVRLAIPRRVYTQSHVDYILEQIAALRPQLHHLPRYRFKYQASHLRHFTAKFTRHLH